MQKSIESLKEWSKNKHWYQWFLVHKPLVFGPATSALQWYQWFPMVAIDEMVTIHRYGLVRARLSGAQFAKNLW